MSLIIESEYVTINFATAGGIPIRLLLVGRDLNVRVRLAAGGREVEVCGPAEVATALSGSRPDAVVVDLDDAGAAAIERVRSTGYVGRIVGFFSHVDGELGRAASDAGAEVYPRGRFWKEIDRILS